MAACKCIHNSRNLLCTGLLVHLSLRCSDRCAPWALFYLAPGLKSLVSSPSRSSLALEERSWGALRGPGVPFALFARGGEANSG